MAGVQRARFCYNRKDAEATYFPADEALYGLKDDFLRDGKLDLGGWGIRDIDMPEVATVALANVDAKAETGGVTSLYFSKCWRLTDDGMESLTRPCINKSSPNRLETLSLAGCNLLTNKSAFFVSRAFNKLLSVDVSGTAITDDGLQLILGTNEELRSLGLRDLPGLTDRGLLAILQYMKRCRCLQNLQLCRSLRFTNEGLLAILSSVDLLHSLDIHGCSQLSEVCLMGLERMTFKFTQLRTLNVRGMDIASIGLSWVAQGCNLLEQLDVSRCSLLTDQSLEYLAEGSGVDRPTPLKVLNLAQGRFTDEGMAVLLSGSGPTLESLTLDGVTKLRDATVRSIARHCPNLKSLSMVELTRMSDRSFKDLGKGCPLLRLLDSSSNLNMLETSHRTRVPKLGARGIREMSVGTDALVVLRLNGVCKITDGALEAVGENCPLLEELYIRSCNLVTDVGIAAVARGCPLLRHLGAGGCVRLTDASLRVVAIKAGRRLRALDITGCFEVTDHSLDALGEHCRGLESLTMQGCERISDQGLVKMLKRCRNIMTLNVRAVHYLTEDTVEAVEVYCRRLHRLNMEGIPSVSSSRVQLAGQRLPFTVRDPGTRVLRSCSHPCRLFNAHVQERVERTASAITVQRIVRGQLCRLRRKRDQQRRAWARRILRESLSGIMATRLHRKRLQRRRAEHAAARVSQAGVRDRFYRRKARAELERLRRERDAVTSIQRVARGRLGRLTAKSMKLIRNRAWANWECTFQRLCRHARAIALWRASLSLIWFYQKLRRILLLKRYLLACQKIQQGWRNFLRRRAQKEAEQAEVERRTAAANRIKRTWRSYYRTKWLLRDVRLREQELKRQRIEWGYAQMELASWWRRLRENRMKQTAFKQLIVARKAVNVIKRSYRSYAARTLVARGKRKAVMMRSCWRRFYLGIIHLPRSEGAIKIQRTIRRFLMRRKMIRAAAGVQRMYRRRLTRRRFVVKLARMYTTNVINIQRVGRGHIARRGKVRQMLQANHASRVITRAICAHIMKKKAFRRMMREARSRRAELEHLRHEALVGGRAEAQAYRALLVDQQGAARAIQAWWRQRRIHMRLHEENLLKKEMDRRKAFDKQARQDNIDELRKKRKMIRVGGVLSALGRRFNKLTAMVDPETADHISIVEDDGQQSVCPLATKVADGSSSASATEEEEREKHEIDVKANATLNYQTSSTWKCAPFHGIHSVGICDIQITVGIKEREAFSREQQYLKATREGYMTRVNGDLSGKNSLHVHLWVRMGRGDGVVTAIALQRAPLNCGIRSLAKARENEARRTSHLLVSHDRCQLELMCKVFKRTEETAPVVDDIVMCLRMADEANLLKEGYERLNPTLRAFGLGKARFWPTSDLGGFLFVHRKMFKGRPKMVGVAKHRLNKKSKSWFTPRTALLLEKYALTEEEVVDLYDIFSRSDFKKDNTMDVYSFFSEMGELETRYGLWLLEAVGAGGTKADITWDHYLEVVCFFGMFSRQELLRFVFGALDPTMRGFLQMDVFHKFITVVTEHEFESGIPGNYATKVKRGFARLAMSGTQLDFKEFEKLCAQFPRLLYPIYRLQTAVQTQNLGERFWDEKKEAFVRGRRAIGVYKIF
ncbi:unnamed protein product [Ascophyllum nodosum]